MKDLDHRIEHESDIEELKKLSKVQFAENQLLRQRIAKLTQALADAQGLAQHDLLAQEAKREQRESQKWSKGSQRRKRKGRARRDNKKKDKPALSVEVAD